VQFHWFAVDTHVGDASASRDNTLADIEGSWNPDRLNGYIDASTLRQFHDVVRGVSISAVDQSGCAKLFCDCQALVVQVDHVDRRR
jgi:hypothetical protein